MNERVQPRIHRPRTALRVAGTALLAAGCVNVNTSEQPSIAFTGSPSPRSTSGELLPTPTHRVLITNAPTLTPTILVTPEPTLTPVPTQTVEPTPSILATIQPLETPPSASDFLLTQPESINERFARLNITPELQAEMSHEFDAIYQIVKNERFIDAGNGALRVQYGQDKNSDVAALEYQAFGELLAIYSGDYETAERLMKFDDRYKYTNTGESDLPDGLTPWEVHISDVGNEKDVAKIWSGEKRKKDGEVNWADMTDPTVVSNVMMYMALARTLHEDPTRQAEGKEIFDRMAENGMIDSGDGKNVPQAFHWADSENLTNPGYLSVVLMETAARVSPDWANTASGTKEFLGKIDERIRNGEYAAAPNWTNIDGKPRNNESSEPVINYDIAYFVLNNLHTAIYSEDPTSRDDAIAHLELVNAFFQNKIAVKDEAGNVTGYDSSQLKDGYKLDGSLDKSEDRYSNTAFTTAAFMASVVSADDAYRAHMLETFKALERPTYEPVNDLFNVAAAGLIGGRFTENVTQPEPTPTPESTVEPTITPEPTEKPEPTLFQEFEGIVGPGEEVHEGPSDKPEIFFTIDDGWDADEIEQILDIAKKYGAKLTLFPVGEQVQENPELYRRAYREGHSIQNHSWDHTFDFQTLSKMTDKEIDTEIKKQRKLVRGVLGVEQQVFVRIPFGSGMGVFGEQLTERISRIARENGLAIAAWSAISSGWEDGRQNTVKELKDEIRKGAILTLHDEPEDIEALEVFIKRALKQGIQPVTMDRLFRDK